MAAPGQNNHLGTKEADAARSQWNLKPYRSRALKVLARKTAHVGADGAFHSTTQVLFHDDPNAKKGHH